MYWRLVFFSLGLSADICVAISLATSTKYSGSSVEGTDGRAYVSFVHGMDYLAYAVVLTASLHELGHRRPHVYLVRAGSPEERIVGAMAAEAQEMGWNLQMQTYTPIELNFHTSFDIWDEAWQRVTLYGMTDRFERVLHLDTDMVAFSNFEDLLENGKVPTVARRMGSCSRPEDLCVNIPVSNFMLIAPDKRIDADIVAWLKNAGAGGNADETVQFKIGYGGKVNLFSPKDFTYFDCFANQQDEAIPAVGVSADRMPRVVHLGMPGKDAVKEFLRAGFSNASTLDSYLAPSLIQGASAEQAMKARVLSRWHELFASNQVQRLLKFVSDSADKTALLGITATSRSCD